MGIQTITDYFSPRFKNAIDKISSVSRQNIQEIRLRVNRPLGAVIDGREYFITENGGLTGSSGLGAVAKCEDIEYSFKAVCDYSVHSFQRELSQCFITVRGGHRIGLCGTAVTRQSEIETVKNISGMNFRIASQRIGCAQKIYDAVFSESLCGVLIIGAPFSAKTTMLRDLSRLLGMKYKTSVIDERGEIGAVYKGVPQNDVGIFTDVFDGFPKAEGINTAIRVMAPEVIVCDEIGSEAESRAISEGLNSGVKIVASAHAGSIDEVYRRKYICSLLNKNAFEYIVLLGNGKELGTIKKIKRTNLYDNKVNRHLFAYNCDKSDGN